MTFFFLCVFAREGLELGFCFGHPVSFLVAGACWLCVAGGAALAEYEGRDGRMDGGSACLDHHLQSMHSRYSRTEPLLLLAIRAIATRGYLTWLPVAVPVPQA